MTIVRIERVRKLTPRDEENWHEGQRVSCDVHSQKTWEVHKDASECRVRADGVSLEGSLRGCLGKPLRWIHIAC